MFSWPVFDKWSLLIFDECTSFSGGPEKGMPVMTKGRGLSVSLPDIKLWIYWFWLGKLRCICPLHAQRTVNKNGILCSECRKTSHVKGHQETLENKVFKSNRVVVTWHLKNIIKILSVPSVDCVSTTLHKLHRLQWEGGMGPLQCWLCVGSVWTGTEVCPDSADCESYVQTLSGTTADDHGDHPWPKTKWVPDSSLFVWKPLLALRLSCGNANSLLTLPPLLSAPNHASGEVMWLTISGT